MKLILFDIDGTLLTTNGAARRAFHRALIDVFDGAGVIAGHDFAGKTDPQIAREVLTLHGLDSTRIDAGLASLWDAYLRELELELARPGHATSLMPGVREVLDALHAEPGRALVGLLTGNIAPGAALKLAAAGLAGRFDFGAYGSDAERRDALPPVAIHRARERYGLEFRGRDIVIIGDTPHDMTCGRALDVTAFGVTTGRHDEAVLRSAGAHHVVPDLSDTERVLALLLD